MNNIKSHFRELQDVFEFAASQMMIFFLILKYQGVMVGFKDKLLFSNNKREMTKDLEFFNRNKVSYQ